MCAHSYSQCKCVDCLPRKVIPLRSRAHKLDESGGSGGQHQKRIRVREASPGGKAPGHVEIENLRDDSAQRDPIREARRLPADPDVRAR
jgi:hypothetical protein